MMMNSMKEKSVGNDPEEKSSRISQLQSLLIEESNKHSIRNPVTCVPKNSYDEIFENCYLGDSCFILNCINKQRSLAMDKSRLKMLGITHVLNAAKGQKFSQIDTSASFYKDINVKFYGCNLMDVSNCKIETHFEPATEFINEALCSNGKIFVHCYMGVSRSASFVLAYLIRFRQMSLEESIRFVFSKRLIWPNDGFLNKLISFENEMLKIRN